VKVEIKGKELVAIIALICLSILIGLGYNDTLMNIFVGLLVVYAGIDRAIVEVKKRKKGG